MKKTLSIAATVLMIAGLSAGAASAKEKRHTGKSSMTRTQMQPGMTTGQSPTGGNAALSGNNGNSASGSNAIPNIKGGDSGSGR